MNIIITISPAQAANEKTWTAIAARQAGVSIDRVATARITKRSIDARRGAVKVVLAVELFIDDERSAPNVRIEYGDVSTKPPVVIVGGGPAGLFAALRLIELGLRPIIVERGRDVATRRHDIALINRNGKIDPNSNYAFGEGGAGTFSDGKLFTRSKKRGDYTRILQILVQMGASPEILYEAHPHIGTDKLPAIMTAIRKTITDYGGEVLFEKRVTDIIIKDGKAVGVVCGGDKIEGIAVILATGHSATDVYELLHSKGVFLEAKPFAMGVRVEHPQKLIDQIQYRGQTDFLPAATYSLVTQINGRGVYSFCMCPGGFVVPAMTNANECVVNGMSPSNRAGQWANAGIVTEIRESDFAHLRTEYGVLAGLQLRTELENLARHFGGDAQRAPAARLTDFVSGRISNTLPRSSYVPTLTSSKFSEWMPPFIYEALRGGFIDFGAKMRGFLSNEAAVIGVESRTSTPVRIPRNNETLQHPQIENLYPAGEGAGYAGGIVSAAMDGERIANTIKLKVDN